LICKVTHAVLKEYCPSGIVFLAVVGVLAKNTCGVSAGYVFGEQANNGDRTLKTV